MALDMEELSSKQWWHDIEFQFKHRNAKTCHSFLPRSCRWFFTSSFPEAFPAEWSQRKLVRLDHLSKLINHGKAQKIKTIKTNQQKLCNSAFVSFQQKYAKVLYMVFDVYRYMYINYTYLYIMYYMYFFPKCFATSKLLGTVFQPSLRPLDWRHIVQRIVRGPQEAAGHAMRRSCCGSITSNEATRQGQLQSRLTGCLREKGREELKTCLFFGWEMFFFGV